MIKPLASRLNPFFLPAALLAIFFLHGCGPALIARKGVEMTPEKARLLDFSEAEETLAGGSLDKALTLYSAFVKNYPDSHLLDDAYYRIGQIYMRQNRYPSAISAYQHIVETYRKSELVNITKFQIGYCYQKLGNITEATDFFLSADLPKLSTDVQEYVLKTLYENIHQIADPERKLLILDQILTVGSAPELKKGERSPGRSLIPVDSVVVELELRRLINSAFNMDGLLRASDTVKSPYANMLIRLRIGLLYSHQKNTSQAEEMLKPLISKLETDPEAIPPFARTVVTRIQKRFHPDPYAIGILLPLRGPFAQWGQSLLNGILFSLNYLTPNTDSADGWKIDVPPFVLHIRDAAAPSPPLSEIVDSLVYDDKVSLIIGPLQAEQTTLVARKTKSLGIPIISFSPKEGMADLGEYVFQNALTTKMEVEEILTFLKDKLKAQNVALLFPDNNYGHQFARHFWREGRKQGVLISAIETYPPLSKDFVIPLKKMVGLYYLDERKDEICPKSMEPAKHAKNQPIIAPKQPCYTENELPPLIDFDVLIIPDFNETVSQIVPHLAYLNINGIQLVGTSAWDAEKLLEKTGAYSSGAIFLDTFNRFSNTYYVKNFYRSYQSHFNEPPDRFVADGFDTMEIIKYIYEQKKEIRSRADIQSAIKSISHFPGVTGDISVEADGRWKRKLSFFIVDETAIRPLE